MTMTCRINRGGSVLCRDDVVAGEFQKSRHAPQCVHIIINQQDVVRPR